jgi:hypothetical protein
MNEVQLLRRQIATERQHAREAAAHCACVRTTTPAASRVFSEINSVNSSIYDEYIMYYIVRERARALAHIARLSPSTPLAPAEEVALRSLRDALEETANPDAALHLIDATEAIEKLAERCYKVEDWRSVAQVDADSILQERRLWAEVIRHGTVTPGR